MDKRKITTVDAITIAAVAVCIIALVFLVRKHIALPETPKDHCTYEIKYLHMSGNEVTKRIYMTCQGFYPWYEDPQRYKVPVMVLPFLDGNKVLIQGATDILSVAKITDDEQPK